jgi:DNA-binding response OmpR family regulator
MMTANTAPDSKRIFLVDDDRATADLYSNRLEQAGFRTVAAFAAEEALGALPDVTADLIIVDLMLPQQGGIELLHAIRSDVRHKATPVLILSNAYLPELAQKALRAGGTKALPRSECTSNELISVSRSLAGLAPVVGPELSDGRSPQEMGSDATLTEQLQQDFAAAGSSAVAAIRQHCHELVEVGNSEEGKEHLSQVYQMVRLLSTRAGLAGCGKIAQLTGAMEAMLFDQMFRLKGAVSLSSVQTLRQAVDCLEHLYSNGDLGCDMATTKASVLLVDDDEICNMANEVAFKRANYESVGAKDAGGALNLLADYTFDLILLDIEMPGMDGIELCRKLRSITHHQNTPVIFVTQHADFDTRAQSLHSGGDDLIAKPIAALELIVKATVSRFSTAKPPIPDQPPRFRKLAAAAGAAGAVTPSAFATGSNGGDEAGHRFEAQALNHSPEQQPQRGSDRGSEGSFRSAVSGKLQHLREALAEETRRREAVEQQAIENAQRRRSLEAAIEDNQRSQERFQKLVEESQQQTLQAEQPGSAEQLNLTGRRRALVEVANFVADKLIQLKQALAEETKRREAVEQEVVENARRRSQLEAALRESERTEAVFQQEQESADHPQPMLELESSLAESQEARARLESELETTRRELEAIRSAHATREAGLAAKTQELQARQTDVAQQIQTVTAAQTTEASQREQAERQASETANRQSQLEAELAEIKQAQEQVRQQLEAAQNQLRAQSPGSDGDRAMLEATVVKLQTQRATWEEKLQSLSEALAIETKRWEDAEQQALQVAQRERELEAELAGYQQTQAQLQQELADARKQHQADVESAAAERSQLETRSQEMQAAYVAAEQQVAQRTEALRAETARREAVKQRAAEHARCRSELEAALAENELTEKMLQLELEASDRAKRWGQLEAELAENKQAQAQLREQLEEAQRQLQFQREQTTDAEDSGLAARAERLEAAQAAVELQVQQLSAALAEEAQRRAGAEQQAVAIGQRRSELENELNQLQQQLTAARRQQEAQDESARAEQARLEARTRELQVAQAQVEAQVQQLSHPPKRN